MANIAAARPLPAPPHPTRGDQPLRGAVPGLAKAAGDTIVLMGPHGSGAPYIGNFEDAGGGPDWNGWTSRDFTVPTETWWHADTYRVVSGVYSAWCGDAAFPSCGGADPAGGYGNDWDVALEWRGTVPRPGCPARWTSTRW